MKLSFVIPAVPLVIALASGAAMPRASAGGASSRIHTSADAEALTLIRNPGLPAFEAVRTLDQLPRPGGIDPTLLDALLDVIDEAGGKLDDAIEVLDASIADASLSVQDPGVLLPRGVASSDWVRELREKLAGARSALARALEFGDSKLSSGLTAKERVRFERDVARAAACILIARAGVLGEPLGDVDAINSVLGTADPELLLDPCGARSRRGPPSTSRSRDVLRAKLKKARRKADSPGGKRAETDEYGAVQSVGKESGGFYVTTTLFELVGDVDASVEVGRFSPKAKVAAASGDGEFQCIEVATVGSESGAAFVSACARYVVSGPSAGFQGFISTPSGNTGNLFLPGVTRAELRIELRSGTLTAFLREADVGAAFQQIGSVQAPAGPLTFSLGAAGLGPRDEVGFDDLSLEALPDAD
ncbi:MAG: hypothetical protein HMLKMBBP_00836 [Planctomycetes bacterium]|nr:hypothetical protein [Planctomycetota bacterium]